MFMVWFAVFVLAVIVLGLCMWINELEQRLEELRERLAVRPSVVDRDLYRGFRGRGED